jgi:hypothetical protein
MTRGRPWGSALAWCAIAALCATGCASTAELARQGRWFDVCERAEGGRGAAEAEVELRRWLDADLEIGVIDEAQAAELLGAENAGFARDYRLLVVRARSRNARPELPAAEQLPEAWLEGAVIDGVEYRALERWVPPIEPGPPPREVDPGPSARAGADATRGLGRLFGTLLGAPIRISTLGTTSLGIQERIEGAGEAIAGGIETAGRVATTLGDALEGRRDGTRPAPPPSRPDPDAVNALLDERRCETSDGRLVCVSFKFLSYLGDTGRADSLDLAYAAAAHDGERSCSRIAAVRAPLPAGESLRARLAAAFATGPLRLTDLAPVDADATR